jgi:hypothetical protein
VRCTGLRLAMTRRSNLSTVETTITIIATICFLPCICVIGGGVIAKDLIVKAKNYERPKKRMRRQAEEKRKEVLRSTPRVLEPRLERHLTIGRKVIISEEEEVGVAVGVEEIGEKGNDGLVVREKKKVVAATTDDQMQSMLFQLPLEIRRQIWEETMGGYVFHIYFVQAYRRMSHTRCKTREPEMCKGRDTPPREPCRNTFKVPGAKDAWGHSNLLSVLQSCRRM